MKQYIFRARFVSLGNYKVNIHMFLRGILTDGTYYGEIIFESPINKSYRCHGVMPKTIINRMNKLCESGNDTVQTDSLRGRNTAEVLFGIIAEGTVSNPTIIYDYSRDIKQEEFYNLVLEIFEQIQSSSTEINNEALKNGIGRN